MSDFKAILFDLDGTLLDTIEDLADSMNASLAACGFAQRSVAECKYFVGDGVLNFVLRAVPKDARKKETLDKMVQLFRQEYANRWALKTRPYDGVPEMLDGLAAKGLKMGVLSNKPDEFTKAMVAKMLDRWKFGIVCGERKGIPKKPDPMAAVSIARTLAVPAEQFLYVGDTNTDMQTAVCAGMYPVGALWGFRTADELLANGAQTLIERPQDLLKLV